MSFEDARNALLIGHADGFLDDEEFIVLYDYYQPVNPSFPYWNFDPFCLTRVCSTLASLKLTSGWPRMIFRCY